jgi:hypothetical protein
MANKNGIPTSWKYGLPKNYEWEVHNLHAYAELKEQVAKGEKTIHDLKEFEDKFKESVDQRDWRWRRENIMRELAQQNVEDYQSFKDNPKEFMKKAIQMRKAISEWWYRKPKAPAGKGKMVQNKFTGAWQQEYKPNKSMNMKDWLQAANEGKVMQHMNPKGVPLNREPTKDEVEESNHLKGIRNRKIYEQLLEVTNNFGKGFGIKDKKLPGTGAGLVNNANTLPNASKMAKHK